MPDNLYLADLKDMTEAEVKSHISKNYAGDKSGFDYGCPSDKDKEQLSKTLEGIDVLVAYEHVGSWGCDSSSYFLLKDKETGLFLENSGGHCSCYGFEGQYDPQEAPKEYLLSDRFTFWGGGYDDESEAHGEMIKNFIKDAVKNA